MWYSVITYTSPPDTGASTNTEPAFSTSFAKFLHTSISIVLQSISRDPLERFLSFEDEYLESF